ncbi:lysoplasmalogenase [Nocardioides jiangxiensis]|uniref:Lysoplasmalogenase n=1 Tax=Nocardioides jiangxiensis TaxID=3064524 RepID=A0ABT9AWW9_9ACTN|nr:lysoplasmalogenase [Nocardioides sp. WY-20]MDO7866996.1 lysoplasmalogenase [Nocardioides sp. WY-20]
MTVCAWVLFAVLAVSDWVAVAVGSKRAEAFLKPAATLALLAVPAVAIAAEPATFLGPGGIIGGEGHVVIVSPWLFVALGFGLLGDILLLSDSVPRFKAGLAAFLVGHLAYLLAFVDAGADWWTFHAAAGGFGAWLFAALMVAALGFTKDVLPNTWKSGGPGLAIPVALYTLVIATMLGFAFGTGQWLIVLGAVIFVASDSVLARDRFVAPLPRGHLLVMVTYLVGQALIVAGLLG